MTTVSHTELATYLTCPRKHHHAYRDRRIPLYKSDALETGIRVDRALRGAIVELPPLERALVDGHRARWKTSKIQIVKNGIWFEAPISPDVTVIGEIDAIAIDEQGREIIIERKTTSEDIGPGSFFWRRFLKLNPQVTMYLLAKPKCQYVLVDALKKSTLRGKKDESDQELYERAIDGIANNLDAHYQRVQIVRHASEHASHVRDVLGTVRLIQIADEDASYGRLPPRNPGACMNYGKPCEYLPVCSGETTIGDDSRYRTKEKLK